MENIDVILPSIILGMSFILKMSIDRNVDLPASIYAVLELPVDVFVLATSFIAAYTISSPEHFEYGITQFALYIFLVCVAVLIWRKSCKCFENSCYVWVGVLATVNYGICIYALKKAIELV
ncbi:hypothetical protein [Vibrio cholerae]|uniref:hypothetical protein n=1 Tax=Vibrio cholerae TaxID=666 RepID=UPI003080E21A